MIKAIKALLRRRRRPSYPVVVDGRYVGDGRVYGEQAAWRIIRV